MHLATIGRSSCCESYFVGARVRVHWRCALIYNQYAQCGEMLRPILGFCSMRLPCVSGFCRRPHCLFQQHGQRLRWRSPCSGLRHETYLLAHPLLSRHRALGAMGCPAMLAFSALRSGWKPPESSPGPWTSRVLQDPPILVAFVGTPVGR